MATGGDEGTDTEKANIAISFSSKQALAVKKKRFLLGNNITFALLKDQGQQSLG